MTGLTISMRSRVTERVIATFDLEEELEGSNTLSVLKMLRDGIVG